jgi:hypothetical protein
MFVTAHLRMMLKTIANFVRGSFIGVINRSPRTNAAIGQRVRDRSNDRLKTSAAPSRPYLLCMSCFQLVRGTHD